MYFDVALDRGILTIKIYIKEQPQSKQQTLGSSWVMNALSLHTTVFSLIYYICWILCSRVAEQYQCILRSMYT